MTTGNDIARAAWIPLAPFGSTAPERWIVIAGGDGSREQRHCGSWSDAASFARKSGARLFGGRDEAAAYLAGAKGDTPDCDAETAPRRIIKAHAMGMAFHEANC